MQEQLNNLERTLGRLEGKVDEGFKNVYNRLDRINGKLTRHEEKIDSIENEQAQMKGKASMFGVIGGSVVGVFFWWLKDMWQK